MNNLHSSWQQGHLGKIIGKQAPEWKEEMQVRESLLVRPYPGGNAICRCADPEAAKWIADRLNLASILEQMTYDFAVGKTDGSEIVALVRKHI